MPENIVVTLKTEKSGGGSWPFVRGTFAWIGFGAVVGLPLLLADTPDPDVPKPAQIIEALSEGWRAYQAKMNPNAQIPLDPRPSPVVEVVCPNPLDDHGACALVLRGDPANGSPSHR